MTNIKNKNLYKDFCIECRKYVNYQLKEVKSQKDIKGKTYEYITLRAYCEECKEEMSIPGLIDKDQELFDAHFRMVEDLMTKSEINKILEKYNIGKAPLSLALGFGEITVTRYLDGQMPSKKYSDRLKKALYDVKFMKSMLIKNKEKIGELAYNKAMMAIAEGENDSELASKIELVTQYILNKNEEITPLSLQKQLYFVQGFYLALQKQILFNANCEAWLHGPVYPDVYNKYKKYGYNPIEDEENFIGEKNLDIKLSDSEKSVVDMVTKTFGRYSGKMLEFITHEEEPWKKARRGVKTIDYSNEIISIGSIGDYFTKIAEKYNLNKEADVLQYISDMLRKKEELEIG